MSKIKHPTTDEEKLQFDVDHNLSLKQGEQIWTLYSALKGCLSTDEIYQDTRWDNPEARRSITRLFYEGSFTKASVYQTKEARDILNDDLLDKEEQKKRTTDEHPTPPQVVAHWVCWDWKEEFEGNLSNLLDIVLFCSQTIKTTVEQNKAVKTFTVNDESTGNVLKVKCIAEERYKKAGIDKLWNKVEGRYVLEFPFKLGDRFPKFTVYEKEHLLIS